MIERSCGVLLPVSALPSAHGIGTLGPAAYAFADFLKAAGQRWWQVLPMGPTGCGDSPYSSFSGHAGNPYYIDLELLAQDGLLEAEDVSAPPAADPSRVDYGELYRTRFALLEKAAAKGMKRDRRALEAFESDNSGWLPDYCLFMALKKERSMRPWTEWEEAVRARRPDALDACRRRLGESIRTYSYLQYLFYKQWDALHGYLKELGIGVIGDMPVYAALDSADVWASPELFQMDGRLAPTGVAGVPPDAFTDDGQLWGNPLYDWDRMKADGYGWWIRRVAGAARLYDMVRIDHFRGFESYWSVPAGEKTAKNGRWVKGPGMELIGVLTGWFPQLRIIAEDLGYMTPEVKKLLADSGLPGMRVLEFAFDSSGASPYLPHRYCENCVCYIGTHDNATALQWLESSPEAELDFAKRYLGLNREEGYVRGLMRGCMASSASLFILQMQDLLELGGEARMNLPGTVGGNWQWRLLPGQVSAMLAEKLRAMTGMYGRIPEESIQSDR